MKLHVSDSFSVHYQELFTVHSAMVYVIQVCRQLSSRIRKEHLILLESCLQTCMPYTIAECTVNNSWWWTEELSEICRISFQNKFEKLVHLVGFIVRKWSLRLYCGRSLKSWNQLTVLYVLVACRIGSIFPISNHSLSTLTSLSTISILGHS
jgi:hypothetical protein